MKRIWIFGASMSMGWEGFGDGSDGGRETNESERWTNLLKDKLGYDEVINHSGAGNSNLEILWKFIMKRDQIGKNDLVIFQFVHFEMIKTFPFDVKLTDLSFDIVNKAGGLDHLINTYNNTILRDGWETLFVNWCKTNKIDFLCWFTGSEEHIHNQYLEICRNNFIHIPDCDSKFGIFDDWQIFCEDQWLAENDKHFNSLGHKRFCELIFEQVKEKNLINNG